MVCVRRQEEEDFLGQMGPERGQAREEALGLDLTEDCRKISGLPAECEPQSMTPPSWDHCHFIILEAQCEHWTCRTAPRKPVCGKLAFLKLLPLSAKWSLASLCLEWQIGSLAHSQYSITSRFSILLATATPALGCRQ